MQEEQKNSIKESKILQIMDSITAEDIISRITTDLDKVEHLLKEAKNHKLQLTNSMEANEMMLRETANPVVSKRGQESKPSIDEIEQMAEFWSTIEGLLEAKLPILRNAQKVLVRESLNYKENVQRSQELLFSGETSDARRNLNDSLLAELARLEETSVSDDVWVAVLETISGILNRKKPRYLSEHRTEREMIMEGLSRGLVDVEENLLDPRVVLQQVHALLLAYPESRSFGSFMEPACVHLAFLSDVSFFAFWPFQATPHQILYPGIDGCEVLVELEQTEEIPKQSANLVAHQIFMQSLLPRFLEFCGQFLDPLDLSTCKLLIKDFRLLVERVYKQNKSDENLRQVRKLVQSIELAFQEVLLAISSLKASMRSHLGLQQTYAHLMLESLFEFQWLLPQTSFLDLLLKTVYSTFVDRLDTEVKGQIPSEQDCRFYQTLLAHLIRLVKGKTHAVELMRSIRIRNEILQNDKLRQSGSQILQ